MTATSGRSAFTASTVDRIVSSWKVISPQWMSDTCAMRSGSEAMATSVG